MRAVLASLAVLLSAAALSARAAEVKTVKRAGRTVEFIECPRCTTCVRFASDGRYATVNLSLLKDVSPSARAFARLRDAMLERAFAAMDEAAAAPKPFWGAALADAWRTNGVPPRAVRRDADVEILARASAPKPGSPCELALCNLSDDSRVVEVDLSELGFAGDVELFDLTERAILPDVRGKLSARVPGKETRVFRLSPAGGAGRRR